MSEGHEGRRIEESVRVSAGPERAWVALADPRELARWYVDEGGGELLPGGRMTWGFSEFGWSMPLEVVEVEPMRRFVLRVEQPGRTHRIEFSVEPDEDGSIVGIVDSGYGDSGGDEDEDLYQGCVSGWQLVLAQLKLYLEEHDGRDRAHFLAMAPATFQYEQLMPFFREEDLLARWLTGSGSIGAEGAPVRLALRDAGPLTGRVLKVTSREVALTWDEIEGVLTLKAFSAGPGKRMVGLDGFGWGLSAERRDGLREWAKGAVARLAAALAS